MVIKILLVLLAFQVCAALPGNFTWSDKDGLNYMGINQNQNLPYRCESGWAFATVNALNPRLKIRMNKTNFPSPTVSLSVQVLLECDTFDFGCLGGEPSSAIRWIQRNNLTDESCNYYKAKGYTNGLTCTSKSKCESCTAKHSCKGQPNSKIYSLAQRGSVSGELEMVNEIYQYGPVSCGISATNQFKAYTNGIFKDKSGTTKFDHYVTIYGWGETAAGDKYWNVMNSYGPAWGEYGNIRIGIESLCYWASFRDTWTKDIRNDTLPTSSHMQAELAINEKTVSETLNLPPYLSPSKSLLSPDYCDSSWAFAVTHMLSDSQLKRSKGLSLKGFSVQALLNCGVGSCQKGGNPFDVLVFIHKYGIPEQGCQNYKAESPAKESCTAINNCANCGGNSIYKQNCTDVKNYKRWKIFDYGTAVGEAQIKMQLDNHGALVCGIQLSKAFKEYKGGIFSETTISPKINYYVELVGHASEGGVNYWIGRNFFGTAWGLSGYFKIKMGSQNIGIETKCYWGGALL